VSRSRRTAAFKLWSKSTNVSAGHKRVRSSSRGTISPGRFEQHGENLEGLLLQSHPDAIAAQFAREQIGLEDSELDQPCPIPAFHGRLPFLEPAKFSRTGVFQLRHLSS
jgi:hypothetical protein